MASPRPMKRKKVPVLEDDAEEQELHMQFAAAHQSPAPAEKESAPDDTEVPESDELQLSPEEEERHKIWDIFSEEYHDIVTELPLEFQRNFHLVRELEDAQQNSTRQLKSLLLDYVSSLGPPAGPTSPPAEGSSQHPAPAEQSKDQLIASITKSARSAIRAGEDKVGLAVTLYESVDRHIRRLDASLLAHEDSLLMGLRDGTLPSHDAPQAADKDPPGPTTSRAAIAFGDKAAYPLRERPGPKDDPSGDKKDKKLSQRDRERKRKREEKKRRAAGLPLVEMLDIPIDPTEPTYCKCNRVSFGNMIGCENEDCPREWFHMECVGLTTAPLGVWYCEECTKSLGLQKEPPKGSSKDKEKEKEKEKEKDKDKATQKGKAQEKDGEKAREATKPKPTGSAVNKDVKKDFKAREVKGREVKARDAKEKEKDGKVSNGDGKPEARRSGKSEAEKIEQRTLR